MRLAVGGPEVHQQPLMQPVVEPARPEPNPGVLAAERARVRPALSIPPWQRLPPPRWPAHAYVLTSTSQTCATEHPQIAAMPHRPPRSPAVSLLLV
jgi:hypothetical protein